jgi:hypothetical protein
MSSASNLHRASAPKIAHHSVSGGPGLNSASPKTTADNSVHFAPPPTRGGTALGGSYSEATRSIH